MSITLRRDPRTVIPDFIDWFEEPFLTLRPYLVGQPIRIEDYTEDGHYVVRAEIPGVDPEKGLEVAVADGYLSIHTQRSGSVEGRHHSEFRYGAFSRTVELPADADADDVTAECANGILTVRVAVRGERPEAAKKIPVAVGHKLPNRSVHAAGRAPGAGGRPLLALPSGGSSQLMTLVLLDQAIALWSSAPCLRSP